MSDNIQTNIGKIIKERKMICKAADTQAEALMSSNAMMDDSNGLH